MAKCARTRYAWCIENFFGCLSYAIFFKDGGGLRRAMVVLGGPWRRAEEMAVMRRLYSPDASVKCWSCSLRCTWWLLWIPVTISAVRIVWALTLLLSEEVVWDMWVLMPLPRAEKQASSRASIPFIVTLISSREGTCRELFWIAVTASVRVLRVGWTSCCQAATDGEVLARLRRYGEKSIFFSKNGMLWWWAQSV